MGTLDLRPSNRKGTINLQQIKTGDYMKKLLTILGMISGAITIGQAPPAQAEITLGDAG